jgi:uncharacterized membrane protein YphA (DoxX/SURF4 family)
VWLFGSSKAAWIWLVVRLWLGYEWVYAGWEKMTGPGKAAWMENGKALKGFAAGAIASSKDPEHLNFSFVFSGSAGVNPAFIIVGLLLVLAWRNAGWYGLDRFVLPRLGTLWHRGELFEGRNAGRQTMTSCPPGPWRATCRCRRRCSASSSWPPGWPAPATGRWGCWGATASSPSSSPPG